MLSYNQYFQTKEWTMFLPTQKQGNSISRKVQRNVGAASLSYDPVTAGRRVRLISHSSRIGLKLDYTSVL